MFVNYSAGHMFYDHSAGHMFYYNTVDQPIELPISKTNVQFWRKKPEMSLLNSK